jgi:hypothetical protein
VGILPLEPLPEGTLSEIREALEESLVLYPVDLVDLSETAPEFRERVEREGILWRAQKSHRPRRIHPALRIHFRSGLESRAVVPQSGRAARRRLAKTRACRSTRL